jgi:stress response protein YsnF
LVVAADEDAVKSVPAFDDEREITPEYESEIHPCYGLEGTQASEDRGRYGAHLGCSEGEHPGEVRPGMRMGDTETGEFRGHGNGQEGLRQAESDLEDKLRVLRTEEELRADTREREAGAVNMRKRVRTDRERLGVTTRREEVTVDRLPVEADAAKAVDR